MPRGENPAPRRAVAQGGRRAPTRIGSGPPPRRDASAELARRRRDATQAKIIRRRRVWVILAALSLVAATVASCNLASATGSHGHHPSTSSGPPSSTKTTTTVMPASFNVGIHTFDLKETGVGIWHVGPAGQQLPGRVLTTEVRYPSLAGAASEETVNARPTTVGGPYPVIVFAHGWNTEPSDYEAMLDYWVKAGFVVVSPIFPDENAVAVAAAGGPGTEAASDEENDVYSEPGDIVYVLKQLQNIGSQPWGTNLKSVLNLSDVGLAGQSDGANVVAALAYASGLASSYAEIPSAPKAVAVMSGSAWDPEPYGKAIGTYHATATSPALLQIQSDADGCVPPTSGPTDLFSTLQTGLSSKWWVTLLNANHLAPFAGTSQWAPVVDAVTTQFFELELNWRSSSVSASSVQSAGTVSGVAQVTTTVTDATVPHVPLIPGC